MTQAAGHDPLVVYHLRLIIAGTTPRSCRAIENLRLVCDQHLKGRVDLEIIDIYQQPALAEKYQAVAAPTLIKLLPLPVRRLIGDLATADRVLRGLEIVVQSPAGSPAEPPTGSPAASNVS